MAFFINPVEIPKEITISNIRKIFRDYYSWRREIMNWDFVKEHKLIYDFMVNYFETPVDEENESVESLLFRILHNVPEIPMCPYCGEKYQTFMSIDEGFSGYCSVKSHKCRRLRQKENNNTDYDGSYDNVEDVVNFFKNTDGSLSLIKARWDYIEKRPKLNEYFNNFFKEGIDRKKEKVKETLYRMLHHIEYSDIPMCKECNKHKVEFISFEDGYRDFCSHGCASRYVQKHLDDYLTYSDIINTTYTKDNIESYFLDKTNRISSVVANWEYAYNHYDLYLFLTTYFDKPIDESLETVASVVYRITHDLEDIPTCPICGNYVDFKNYTEGFQKFCSHECYIISKINDAKERVRCLNKVYEDSPYYTNTQFTIEELESYIINSEGKIISPHVCWKNAKKYKGLYEFLTTYFDEPIDENYENVASVIYRIKNDIITYPKCLVCNENKVKFLDYYRGYRKFCSNACRESEKGMALTHETYVNNCLEQYGVDNLAKTDFVKNKIKKHFMDNYGVVNPMQIDFVKKKAKETSLKHWGSESFIGSEEGRRKTKEWWDNITQEQLDEINESKKKSYLKKYGVIHNLLIPEVYERAHRLEAYEQGWQTKKDRCVTDKSAVEDEFNEYLINRFGIDGFERQYIDKERYNYRCDFYIKSLDLFIEIQGTWTHGNHPYDFDSVEDNLLLEFWKEKAKEKPGGYYDTAIQNWINKDVKKRNVAWDNKLNYLEIFSKKGKEAIEAFEKYLDGNEPYAVFIYDK